MRQILLAADLQPHRWRYWLTRPDPEFEEIAARILDLYESPPEGRLLCFDEKTQLRALERKHVGRPMRPGDPERIEFEYKRGGTLNLFCTLDVRSGEVRHMILDNPSTHETPDVLEFVARDRKIHLHFLPKHGSGLNQVELFFSVLVRRVIRRDNFRGLADLRAKILAFLSHWNAHEKKPFRWTYTAEDVLAS